MAHELRLPAEAKERGLSVLVPLLNAAEGRDEVRVDFQEVRFYHPASIVVLLARLRQWGKDGKQLYGCHFNKCPARDYLKRMDFFDQLGLQLDEPFQRHNAAGRFVSIRKITSGHGIDRIAREVASCMARESTDVLECLSYAIGEIITNVAQHSQGEGFLCAQRYPATGVVRVAVADNGIGLRRSFDGTPLEQELHSPLDALQKAMEPKVSAALLRPPTGPYAQPVNRGVGLSMVDELVRQTYGRMQVITEDAVYTRIGDTGARFQQNSGLTTPGVLVSIEMTIDEIVDYQSIINDVRARILPSGLDNWDEMFE
ncbi:MAG: ATP-binding protein [Akkermansiaceae bacterium]|nr:ATP-binding protein [Akkermansiaceae bacterium]